MAFEKSDLLSVCISMETVVAIGMPRLVGATRLTGSGTRHLGKLGRAHPIRSHPPAEPAGRRERAPALVAATDLNVSLTAELRSHNAAAGGSPSVPGEPDTRNRGPRTRTRRGLHSGADPGFRQR
jgi:hypothetical protein